MDIMDMQVEVADKLFASEKADVLLELSAIDLGVIGGGCGEVVFG